MCEPISATTAISTGATVLGAGLGIMDRMSSRGAAVANRGSAVNTALTQTVPSINQSLAQIYNSNQARSIQESDKAATDAFDVTRQMAEAKGTAAAAAAEGGVGGNSFSTILGDFEMREGLARGSMDYNYKTKVQQVADENASAQVKAKGQINSVVNAAVAGTPIPSETAMWAGAAGDAIGAGLKIADRFDLFKTKVDPSTGVTITRK